MQANFLNQFSQRIIDAIALGHRVEAKLKKFRIHRFKLEDLGLTFVIELSQKDGGSYVMTSSGAAIRQGDHIAIQNLHSLVEHEYQVVDINFYDQDSDAWIAQLNLIRRARIEPSYRV
jgi:hypothetical protein